MVLKKADQAERGRAHAGRDAAEVEVSRQVRGDEDELEAAGEEGGRHVDEAAMVPRVAQRGAQALRRADGTGGSSLP